MEPKFGHQLSWVERLHHVREEVLAAHKAAEPPPRKPDPWELQLAEIQGELHEGLERVSTEAVFDSLNIKRSKRNSAAARRLAAAMRHLGWERARWRPGDTPQKVRGFSRPAPEASTDHSISSEEGTRYD
jgi:hypothetical protein